jgi:mannan endo-1,4-beta-mannosidase
MSRTRLAIGASVVIVAAPALLLGAVNLMHSAPTLSQSTSPQSLPTVSAATLARIRNPAHAILGVFELGVPPSFDPVQKFGRAVRHMPALVVAFTGVGQRFPTAFAKTAHRHGASLLIQINPGKIPLRTIASGAYDAWLRGYAHQVAMFGHPVVIGFAHEMNGGWYPWGYKHQPAAAFVAAWRHIVTVFRHQGANGAIWVWTVSHDMKYTAPLRPYWPGSRYVDWVGIDGYYYHRSDTFSNVFGRKLRQIRRITHDPVLLSEVGIGQVAGQARKIPGLIAGIAGNHLAGLVWFDVAQRGGVFKQDWRLEGHKAALAAFRQGLDQLGAQRS